MNLKKPKKQNFIKTEFKKTKRKKIHTKCVRYPLESNYQNDQN